MYLLSNCMEKNDPHKRREKINNFIVFVSNHNYLLTGSVCLLGPAPNTASSISCPTLILMLYLFFITVTI